jgi:protein-histidine pros-kinase
MNLRRFDTLFVRLFLLMWLSLAASHIVAFLVVVHSAPGIPAGASTGGNPPPGADLRSLSQWPAIPSLPPGNPLTQLQTPTPLPPPPPGVINCATPPPALPARLLWLDYGLRFFVIGLGALLGAYWLSAPMRRLAAAAQTLAQGLHPHRLPPVLDEAEGTREVRKTAQVFNHMASRLQAQFDARGLQMAALSHDLRTPLTRLRLRLDALPASMVQAAVGDIQEMNSMIEGALAVLREQQEGGDARVVDLTALMQSVTDDMVEQHLPVTMEDSPPVKVRVHPAALKRIVDNLVSNALRYGVRAHLGVTVNELQVRMYVDDEGPGIAPEHMDKAFLPWVRLTPAHARTGHGLGLALARELAERDGGEIVISNRPQGGLRAELVLPLA